MEGTIMVRGREKTMIKEVIKKAIENGHVSGDKIVFKLKDITAEDGNKKWVMRCCMRKSRRVFGVVKDRTPRIYFVDKTIVECYGDEELVEMFRKKINKDKL